MKLLTIMIFITVVGLCGKACQEKQWRTQNFMLQKWVGYPKCNRKVGVGATTTSYSRPTSAPSSRKKMSTLSLVAVILATVSCVACHIYYALAYMFYRIFRHLWYGRKVERELDEQSQKV